MTDFSEPPARERLEEAFFKFTNHKQEMNKDQFRELCFHFFLAPTKKRIDELFHTLDKNSDSQLTFDEVDDLIGMEWQSMEERQEDFLRNLKCCRKSEGPLSVQELKSILSYGQDEALTDEEIDFCIKEMDIDKNGVITEAELCGYIFKFEQILSRAPSRIESRQRSRSRERKRSRSRSRKRHGKKSRSRSRSGQRRGSKSRSRSRERKRSRSGSRKRHGKKSRSRSRSGQRRGSKSRSRSRGRRRSRSRSRSSSKDRKRNHKHRSGSRDSKHRSNSREKRGRSTSRDKRHSGKRRGSSHSRKGSDGDTVIVNNVIVTSQVESEPQSEQIESCQNVAPEYVQETVEQNRNTQEAGESTDEQATGDTAQEHSEQREGNAEQTVDESTQQQTGSSGQETPALDSQTTQETAPDQIPESTQQQV